MELLKLEIAKTYIRASGYPVKIKKYIHHLDMYSGDDGHLYFENGDCEYSKNYNLVKEYVTYDGFEYPHIINKKDSNFQRFIQKRFNEIS